VQAKALQYGFRPGVALDIDPRSTPRSGTRERHQALRHRAPIPGRAIGKVVKAIRDAFRGIKNKAVVYLVIDRSGSMNAQIMDTELGQLRTRMEMAVESADLLASRLQDDDRLAWCSTTTTCLFRPDTQGQPLAMTADGKARLRQTLEQIRSQRGAPPCAGHR
jgi:Ca-activated chloride channel family protein